MASGAASVRWDVRSSETGEKLCSHTVSCETTYLRGIFESPEHQLPLLASELMTNLATVTIQRFNASKDVQRLSGH